MPAEIFVDASTASVSVSAGLRYAELASELHRQGWALEAMASLPHISAAGAISTGTHGSGDATGTLSSAVRAVELVGPDGELRRLERGDVDFDGSVVAVGALGILARITLDLVPTYNIHQDIYLDLRWDSVYGNFDALTSAAYSVSMFTRWNEAGVYQAWLKAKSDTAPSDLFGAQPGTETQHMLDGAAVEGVTQQLGVPGPWHERLPHFRASHNPSRGDELQSEYFLPRENALEGMDAMRSLASQMAGVIQTSEIRSMRSDDLWLSGAYGRDTVAFHFTWVGDTDAVYALLPAMEELLLPLGARPHWGKCFVAERESLAPLYSRWDDFMVLRSRIDPEAKFANAWTQRVFG
ncbi:D-arabinono-1,4-lactone oxidase [Ornithinimicrobium sp. INDO-MA30-4]|uniref:D-arabinono-1,4-lactone oxidase n=1 Tax=Ornithinimicrobium sp. INDO-MA30-4 TaxID=2908651 RepID=UPI001F3BAA38|nr:D-arabinono-1,4-lactone oxidase [Ornithinimicrobium sp. INDO-MA30-4]UJH69552.1 FAD-binding protein [Ornithinimicrobium sp. INDO-MA30-4]